MNNTPIPARDVVVVGASTGGVEALRQLVAGLPSGFPAAVLIVMHIGTNNTILPSLLARTSILPVRQAREGDLVEAGRILVAPPDLHLSIRREGEAYRVVLARIAKENHTRPAIDPLFRSAAAVVGERAIGVILTGALDDGTAGLAAIKACGGLVVVQDPDEALAPDMPISAIDNVEVDHVVRLAEMPPLLQRLIDARQAGAALKPPAGARLGADRKPVCLGGSGDGQPGPVSQAVDFHVSGMSRHAVGNSGPAAAALPLSYRPCLHCRQSGDAAG
ncbi:MULTISPECIES: chemotaxis protein CheB [unclassified Duganella]|uniref:chemotaxis protein CheB n=1 Tax=unclassified Duganella TaxID=2636909 RepID=UPI000A7777ED|nr:MULTISPECIES: chemotaxis protein CheB [unclassified Duganella]